MRKVVAFAVAAVAVVAFAGPGRIGSTRPARRAEPVRVLVTSPSTSAGTTTTRGPVPSSTMPRPEPVPTTTRSSPTVAPVTTVPVAATTTSTAAGRPELHAPATTTTLGPAARFAKREHALQACLELAAVDNLRVVEANQTWYQRQLAALVAAKHTSGPRFDALQAYESQTKDLIDAQNTIDVSNCYLKDT